MITYLSLSSLTIIFTIPASKWLHIRHFMGEDAELLLGGSKLVNRVDRTIYNSLGYGEGEGHSRDIKNVTVLPKVLHRC